MKLTKLIFENLEPLEDQNTDYSAVRNNIVQALQNSAKELDILISAYQNERSTRQHAQYLKSVKQGLESDARQIQRSQNIYPLPTETSEEVKPFYKATTEPGVYDPETGRISWGKVTYNPFSDVTNYLKKTYESLGDAIKQYPEFTKEIKMLKSDISTLSRSLDQFLKEKKIK